MIFSRFLTLPALCFGLASCVHSQPARPAAISGATLPLRSLIVSGGPSPDYNQYAIESNARYLEKLTARARSRRVLFADGNPKSRTISAQQPSPGDETRRVLAWLIEADEPAERISYRASGLKRIDGAATAVGIGQSVRKLAREVKPGERALLYFTGHGSPGQKTRLTLAGIRKEEDFQNTLYAAWNNGEFSVADLSSALESWPAQSPLILVMVQCHAGGFANLIFEGGDPKKPVLNRNFCGFFAATGERQASGCTSEVDEINYQDFTTHFFAALSGISRDGRRISGADFDKNGAVSMLEALSWANLRDDSIDVPLCTSDAYLRSIWPTQIAPEWIKTSYSELEKNAAPWQRATLEGLSGVLKLSGEGRIQNAIDQRARFARAMENEDPPFPASIDADATWQRFYTLKTAVKTRFPGLSAPPSSARFKVARSGALRYLARRNADVAALSQVLKLWAAQSGDAATHEAQCQRFVRAARTLFLERKLKTEGTPVQKLVFSRLRNAESRNPLR